ncbi:MAG: tyrosine-type recombinase/integrase [Nanoarchaeota archaeon]|nr:tyrosine-type recombinase/integrase [Nanoarchaeota archaeon]
MKKTFVVAVNPFTKKHLERTGKNTEKSLSSEEMFTSLSKKNKKVINEFAEFKTNQGVSQHRLKTMRLHLIKFAYSLEKEFDKATAKDMNQMNGLIQRTTMQIHSKADQIIDVRQLYKWLMGKNKHYPEIVDELIIPKKPAYFSSLKAENLLTDEQIYSMIKACTNTRDKFFIALLGLDGALRPCEAQAIKWKDIQKDEHGYYINIKTAKKSGDEETRPIRIIKSEPYFLKWMQDYPKERKSEFYLFCDIKDASDNDFVSLNTIHSLFRRIKKKLNFPGKLYPYLLRHTLITKLQKDPRIPLAILKKFVGHKQSSNVLAAYTHLSQDDVKDIQLIHNGKETRKEKKEDNMPITCPNCKKPNEYDAEICAYCNMALSQKRVVRDYTEFEEKMKLLEQVLPLLRKIDTEQQKEVSLG